MKKLIHKFKWKIRQLYQRLYYWLEWRFSDERHDPYRCEECGSTDVEIKVWSKVNVGGRYAGDCDEYDRSFCNKCDERVRVRPTSFMLQDALYWWGECDFQQREGITGFRQDDFSSKDGYQDFVNACNKWWEVLSTEEKIRVWIENQK